MGFLSFQDVSHVILCIHQGVGPVKGALSLLPDFLWTEHPSLFQNPHYACTVQGALMGCSVSYCSPEHLGDGDTKWKAGHLLCQTLSCCAEQLA